MWRIQTFSWGQFILFPSISRLFLYWRGKPKSIAKLGGGAWPDIPPWIRHCSSPAAPQVLSVKMFVTQGPIIHRTGIFVWDWFEQGLQVERNITSEQNYLLSSFPMVHSDSFYALLKTTLFSCAVGLQ